MFALIIVNDSSRELDLASLAIDHLVGIGDFLLQGRRVSHELERGTRLIHIAYCVVLKQAGGGVAKIVGIEGGANRQRENLAGIWILDNDGAIRGMGTFERGIERTLRHELDVLVDGENQVFSRVGLALLAVQNMPAGIDRGEHAAGHTVEILVEFALHASQTIVIGAHVAQHLGGKLAVGIEALEFLLEIDALEIQRFHPRDLRGVELARDPGEVSRGVQAGGNLMRGSEAVGRVGVHHFGQGSGNRLPLGVPSGSPRRDFRRHRVDRIGQHGHGQLMQVAVVENSAPRRNLKGALLLPGGTVHVVFVMDDLQPDQAATDQDDPATKKRDIWSKPRRRWMVPACTGRAGEAPARCTGGFVRVGWRKNKNCFNSHLPCSNLSPVHEFRARSQSFQ